MTVRSFQRLHYPQWLEASTTTTFTASCYTERGYVTIMSSVRLSVRFRYSDHIGWNTLKIISRPNTLMYLLKLTQQRRSGPTGTPPKLGWNRGGVTREDKNLQYLRNGAIWDQGYYDGLIGSRIRAFDWYQNQWNWITLNGRNVTLTEIETF